MFTGIVEKTGLVKTLYKKKEAHRLVISVENGFGSAKKGASIAVNGVCLTAVEAQRDSLTFDIMEETFRNTALSFLRPQDTVNLERALEAGSLLDGHFVLGHVDAVKRIKAINTTTRPYIEVTISAEEKKYVVKKGSIAIDGISFTISAVYDKAIRVDIIPYTLKNTNLKYKKVNGRVNIEYDVLGKYIQNGISTEKKRGSTVSSELLEKSGFI